MKHSPDRSVRPRARRVVWLALFALSLPSVSCFAAGEEMAPFPQLVVGSTVDEVIVRSRSLERLQLEVFRAEQSFYDAFNSVNTNHEFDIYCELIAPTGS